MNNVHVEHDVRPLRGFYPDDLKRERIHYLFAHRFFPLYCLRCPAGVLRGASDGDVTRFVQARWQMMEQQIGLVDRPHWETGHAVFRRVADLEAWRETVGGHPALIVRLPAPEHLVHAYFVGLVLLVKEETPAADWPAEAAARYFTLERTEDLCGNGAGDAVGLLCAWDGEGVHRNYGVEVRVDREAFKVAMRAILDRDTAGRLG